MNSNSDSPGRWPSGDCKPILELRFTPEVMNERYGLQFLRIPAKRAGDSD